ncbi:hypothetical protein B0H13DRAFT_1850384 [Mycena leptocephala]|nr:hypothetical protein B0H13DRAFT_1850384 [Mycena leptocephala]
MDRRAPYTARPAAGASWFSLVRLVVLLQGLVPLFWFLEWCSLDGMDWDLAGFGFELEFGILLDVLILLWIGFGLGVWVDDVLVEWIRRRSWKESQWRWIWNVYDSLGGALVAPPYHQLSFSRTLIALIVWIATCIYFVWSPEPARIGLIVFGVFGWISAFTCGGPESDLTYVWVPSKIYGRIVRVLIAMVEHVTVMCHQTVNISSSLPHPSVQRSKAANHYARERGCRCWLSLLPHTLFHTRAAAQMQIDLGNASALQFNLHFHFSSKEPGWRSSARRDN